MSHEARPISNAQFAQAVEDLPIENIYTKAFEINNSIAHLERSNRTLQDYSDSIKNDTSLDASVRSEGDKDCLEAISENEIVIKRQRERVDILKAEVERRGGRWHEAETKPAEQKISEDVENGTNTTTDATPATNTQRGGRYTDEELRQQMGERVNQIAPVEEEDDGGMHL